MCFREKVEERGGDLYKYPLCHSFLVTDKSCKWQFQPNVIYWMDTALHSFAFHEHGWKAKIELTRQKTECCTGLF